MRGHDHPADQVRETDHLGCVGAPLRLVSVQQLLRSVSQHVGSQLPGQVGGIPDAGVQRLPGERRHQVRGVAGQDDPPAAVGPGNALVGDIDGGTADLLRPDGLEGSDKFGNEARLRDGLGPLTGQEHELVPPPALGPGHLDHRPPAVAVEFGELLRPDGGIGDVDDDPLLGLGASLQRNPQPGPHRAPAAVAGQDPPGPDGPAPRPGQQGGLHPGAGLVRLRGLGFEQHLHQGTPAHGLQQHRLHDRLVELRLARLALARPPRADLGQELALPAEVPGSGIHQHVGHKLLQDAELGHHPQRLIRCADRPGSIAGPGLLLDQDHANAVVGEQGGRSEADRPRSDHQHVSVEHLVHEDAPPAAPSSSRRTVLRRTPRPVISTSTTSPSDSRPEGCMKSPTPPGVPVTMTSPAESLVNPVT